MKQKNEKLSLGRNEVKTRAMRMKKSTKADRDRAKKRRAQIRLDSMERLKAEVVFACFSYVACADKPPTPTELRFISEYLAAFDKSESLVITKHSVSSRTRGDRARNISSSGFTCFPQMRVRQKLLEELLHFCVCDGPLRPEEAQAVEEIAAFLKFPADKYSVLRRRWKIRNTVKDQIRSRQALPGRVPWYYELLECSPTDSDEAIKRSYRQLAKKLHPDRHAAKCSSPEESAEQVRRFQELQGAYEEIRKKRISLK